MDAAPTPVQKSKTMWLGAALVIAGAVQSLDWAKLIPSDPRLVGLITAVLGAVVMVLRYITTTPVSFTGK